MKYVFGRNINGSGKNGIVDIETNELICFCTIVKSELLLQALNLHNVSNNEALESSSDGVAVCDCYNYKYSESGKRRWCSNCGREDIGF